MTTLSYGGRDNFRRTRSKCRSLLLDAVVQGRPRASQSPLLQLPGEILALVVDLLVDDKPALSSLALVNSDCRQLARCRQFAEIDFDYSIPAHQLSQHINEEVTNGICHSSIGSCVRRIVFHSRPEHLKLEHQELSKWKWGQREDLEEVANRRYEALRAISVHGFSSGMPNVEVLVWKDVFSLDKNVLSLVSHSPIRHLCLRGGVFINESLKMETPLAPQVWPLRSLCLDISAGFNTYSTSVEINTVSPLSTFIDSFLRTCAPTLESLELQDWSSSSDRPVSLSSTPLSLPNLQFIRFGKVHLDALWLSSLVSGPLRHLRLSEVLTNKHAKLLATHEPFQNLESLATKLPVGREPSELIAQFIEKHYYIKNLSVHECTHSGYDRQYLDSCIMPIFTTGRFSNLSCLSLAWNDGDTYEPCDTPIPATSLAIVGTILSLEQLRLCYNEQFGRRWVVNHADLLAHLSGLCNLKTLALVKDTYAVPEPFSHRDYYDERMMTEEEEKEAEARTDLPMDEVDPKERRKLEGNTDHGFYSMDDFPSRQSIDRVTQWERAHRNRMLSVAEEYGTVLPKLEFMFCGQRPMGFERHAGDPSEPLKVVPLTQCRDHCYTFLERIFGLSISQFN